MSLITNSQFAVNPGQQRYRRILVAVAGITLVVSACGSAAEESVAPVQPSAGTPDAPPAPAPPVKPLAGEQITFVQGHSADGGYAAYVLLLAPCLADELGATVTHEAQPGAGSLVATNQTFVAPGDGTRIQLLQGPAVVALVLSGRDGVEFEIERFTQLGRVTAEPSIAVFGASQSGTTPEDLIRGQVPIRWAASGPGSSAHVDATLINAALGLNAELIAGYDGAADSIVSMVAGEVDAYVASLTLMRVIEAGDATPWAVRFADRYAALPDVPTVLELVQQFNLGATAEAIARAHTAMGELGRLVIGPPGMSEDVATAITDALRNCITNSEFDAAATSQGRPLLWAEPQAMTEAIVTLLDAPQELIDVLTEE